MFSSSCRLNGHKNYGKNIDCVLICLAGEGQFSLRINGYDKRQTITEGNKGTAAKRKNSTRPSFRISIELYALEKIIDGETRTERC